MSARPDVSEGREQQAGLRLPRLVGEPGVTPPHSVEAERHVLSAVLLDETGAGWAVAVQCGVKASAFYVSAHRAVWEAVESLAKAGETVCAENAVEALRQAQKLESVGGVQGFMEITGTVPTSSALRYQCEVVRLLWDMRHTLRLANEMRETVFKCETREAFVEKAGDVGQRLLLLGKKAPVRDLKEEITGAEKYVMARANGEEDRRGWLRTGLALFDERCGVLGSAPEDHYVLVPGGSSHGKSALMRQWAGQALLDGKRVVVLARETTVAGFVQQLVAGWVGMDLRHPELALKEVRQDFAGRCAWLRDELAGKRLWCVQHDPATPMETVEDLEQYARAFVHLHGPVDLWVVDYLQLFDTRKRCNNREQTVATVSHKIQALVRSLGGVWLVGCQMNEAGLREMRTVKRDDKGKVIHRYPVPGDLRESQAAFHDADRVVALYMPPVDCRDNDQTAPNVLQPEIHLCQIKRRWGGTGVVRCWFEKRFTRFKELARHEDESAERAEVRSSAVVPKGGMSKADFVNKAFRKNTQ